MYNRGFLVTIAILMALITCAAGAFMMYLAYTGQLPVKHDPSLAWVDYLAALVVAFSGIGYAFSIFKHIRRNGPG